MDRRVRKQASQAVKNLRKFGPETHFCLFSYGTALHRAARHAQEKSRENVQSRA
jgi:hypothetical protein